MKQKLAIMKQRQGQKKDLTTQMEEKKAMRDLTRKLKVEEELSELNVNQAEMASQAEKEKAARGELKNFWQ